MSSKNLYGWSNPGDGVVKVVVINTGHQVWHHVWPQIRVHARKEELQQVQHAGPEVTVAGVLKWQVKLHLNGSVGRFISFDLQKRKIQQNKNVWQIKKFLYIYLKYDIGAVKSGIYFTFISEQSISLPNIPMANYSELFRRFKKLQLNFLILHGLEE